MNEKLLPKVARKVSLFIEDENGRMTKADVVKAGALIALGLASSAIPTLAQCSCSPACNSACHANSLSIETGDGNHCGIHCHQIIQGGPCPPPPVAGK
ncbi:hypothetical protein HY641_04875 [Candidatus Woesearchaeota archaeon]|nr:hypothetical protein [Candidatus Woesearchaeota archaeon]